MKRLVIGGISAWFLLLATASAEVKIDVGHNDLDHAKPEFNFKEVPSPVKVNAAATAKITIVDGQRDPNGGDAGVLNDGKLPGSEDEPASNFFFNAGTDGGWILIDLGSIISVKQVNTYSWHTDTRAPQVYSLYAADGAAAGFNAKPTRAVDPVKVGWSLIAKVDTRPKAGDPGGQYGASISDTKGALGKYRYLLIAASRSEDADDFGNTFFSEINVIDANPATTAPTTPAGKTGAETPAAPATSPDAKPARSAGEIQVDLRRVSVESAKLMQSPADLLDQSKRKDLAPKLLPILKQRVALITELTTLEPRATYSYLYELLDLHCFLAYLGDADSAKALAAMAANIDSAVALRGKLAQQRVAWWQALKDEKAQEKILVEMQALATRVPKNGNLITTLESFREFGAATAALADKAELIIVDSMTGPAAASIKEQRIGRINQEQAMNKPFELAGPAVDGKDFSTTRYKGKVVLVQFWATWCGPCVKEIPRVKALYAKHHDQGLEVVGVSCDDNPEALAAFTVKQDFAWPQMWDKKAQTGGDSWHPLAKKYGVFSIPALFLIDRNGVLRSVKARENMETMIPKLLEEKASPTPAT